MIGKINKGCHCDGSSGPRHMVRSKVFPTKFHMTPKSGWHKETPCSVEAVAVDARHLPVCIGDHVIDDLRFTCDLPVVRAVLEYREY